MAAITGAFTAAQQVSAPVISRYDGDVPYAITGAFVGKLILEISVAASLIAWVRAPNTDIITGPLASAAPGNQASVYRLRCIAYTSGTISYTITASNTPTGGSVITNGGSYPTANPGDGSGIIWNNGGVLCIA